MLFCSLLLYRLLKLSNDCIEGFIMQRYKAILMQKLYVTGLPPKISLKKA